MKVLYIYRSEPDELTKKLAEGAAEGKEVVEVKLYEGNVDYDKLVELIFSCDQVVCWW